MKLFCLPASSGAKEFFFGGGGAHGERRTRGAEDVEFEMPRCGEA